MVAQLSLSLGVACAGALLGGFTAEVGNDGVDTVLGAFQASTAVRKALSDRIR